jgi:hypothetical protein
MRHLDKIQQIAAKLKKIKSIFDFDLKIQITKHCQLPCLGLDFLRTLGSISVEKLHPCSIYQSIKPDESVGINRRVLNT